MRRYAVRFLVAILTFGIGIALSSVLGFFKPQAIKSELVFVRRSSCSKNFRVARPAFVTVDTEVSDPLKLTYLGETSGRQRQFRLENKREQAISGYSIMGEKVWGPHSRGGETTFRLTSNEALAPGESRSILLPSSSDGLSLRVSSVTFQSGFTWINPRETSRTFITVAP